MMIVPIVIGIAVIGGAAYAFFKNPGGKGFKMPEIKNSITSPVTKKVIDVPPVTEWPIVTLPNGEQWRVAPRMLGAPMGIQEAFRIVQENGWELPTKALVDATYEAADLWIRPRQPTLKVFDAKEMNSPAVLEQHAALIEKEIAGRPFKLLVGDHKDIVRDKHPSTGKVVNGIYGWKDPKTKKEIQDFPSIHIKGDGSGDETDYSQAFRPAIRVG